VKKILLLNLSLVVILTLLLFPTAVLASSDQGIETAQKAAQTWLDRTAAANPELPQWNGAKVTSPQPYESLGGEVNAYMFGIAGEKSIVGYVLVGSSLYGYDVLEAGTAAPPAVPSPSVVQEAVKSLGLKVEMTTIGQPVKLLYTGVDGCYALYVIQNQKVAVNLVFKKAVLVSDLKPSIPSPKEYQKCKKSTAESRSPSIILSDGSNYLNMNYWNGTSPAWCGPCSGVSIGAYYRDYQGYSSLYSSGDMYNSLYYYMQTYINGGATFPEDYGGGFVTMTQACGYNNFSYANDWYVTGSDYWAVTGGIDSGYPTALLVTSQMHWRGIKGYYWSDPSYHYIYCTNSATSQSWEYLNWDSLGLGLFTCRIMD